MQLMSYRVGHHSTSDDSSRYREAAEMAVWRARDPAERLRAYLEAQGLWDSAREAAVRTEKRQLCTAALKYAAVQPRHPAEEAIFDDGARC
jgi:TPP-dependent pyruvate/acetoin dehydrogenase alpha subunit